MPRLAPADEETDDEAAWTQVPTHNATIPEGADLSIENLHFAQTVVGTRGPSSTLGGGVLYRVSYRFFSHRKTSAPVQIFSPSDFFAINSYHRSVRFSDEWFFNG